MKKADQKKIIADAYEKTYGTKPKSRDLKIDFITLTGSLAHFSVKGIGYSYIQGKVTKDA